MDRQALLKLYDAQLRINLEQPGVRKDVFPQLVRLIRPAPGMNVVSYSRLDEANLDAAIEEQVAYLSKLGQPFSWHVYDHDALPALKDRLVAHGFAPDDDPDAVLVLDVQEAAPALLAPITAEVRPVTQREELGDVVRVEEAVLGGEFGWLERRLSDHLDVPDYLSVYVAYVNEQPVCAAWVYFYPRNDFAGLFGGATLPDYRGRGLYRAVLAVRVQEARRRGYRFLATGASPMSRPILIQNGFRLLTRAHAYEWVGWPERKWARPY